MTIIVLLVAGGGDESLRMLAYDTKRIVWIDTLERLMPCWKMLRASSVNALIADCLSPRERFVLM